MQEPHAGAVLTDIAQDEMRLTLCSLSAGHPTRASTTLTRPATEVSDLTMIHFGARPFVHSHVSNRETGQVSTMLT